jgi:uncharacterized RDD family membrane protein YckC
LYCPKCGAQRAEEAAYCGRCGQQFASPVEIVVPRPPPAPLPYADPGRRTAAFILDMLIVLAPIITLSITYGMLSPDVAEAETLFTDDIVYSEDYSGLIAFIMVLSFLGPWLYFAGFESSRRRATPGKMLLGLMVASEEGRPIGFGRATARYFSKYISSSIMFIGFIMAFWSDRRQALHDVFSRTLVLDAARITISQEGSPDVLP